MLMCAYIHLYTTLVEIGDEGSDIEWMVMEEAERLRGTPTFAPLSGKEEIIGGSMPVDDVEVWDMPENEGAFVARLRIPLFQIRMRVSESIALEFIAKGLMWELSHIVASENERTRRKLGHSSQHLHKIPTAIRLKHVA
ncbi:uncharacterized protein BXZ73DRAFT_81812 [Epithele typhae]|uniref:uncharacterized protein n=1 Tax=Epithele typhae TaxID=378194 RepID=UPI0020078BC8|nr:uncharacterized protein BXZ73DRAFT_81812 [Epithele typhae]KAH9913899.1 hypothetical protein BXZ73DRAFT_81812 [Epithele typhae]